MRRSTAGGRGSGLRRPVRSLLRSLHRFSAFQVAGRRSVSLAFSAGRRLVALRELLLVVQEHAAQRPPDVFGAGFVDVVSDRSPRRPALVWFNRAFGGLSLLGDRFRGGHALAPRRHGRGVQEDKRVSPALEGGVAMPVGVALVALVNLPAGPFVPVASGGGSVRPSRSRPASDTRGGRPCRPGDGGSVSSCPLFQSEPDHRDRSGRANISHRSVRSSYPVIRDPREVWVQRVVRRHPSEEDVDQAVAAGPRRASAPSSSGRPPK